MNRAFKRSDWKRLLEYASLLRDEMRLSHWRIWLQDETPQDIGEDERALCYIDPNKNHYSARLYLSAEFRDRSPEEQREALVHELIHVHMRDVATTLDELSEPFGVVFFNLIVGIWHQRMELFVQEMALLIAPRYPLPQIVKKGKKP